MDSTWIPHGFHTDSTRIPLGFHTDSTWIPHGFHKDSMCMDSTGIPLEVHWEGVPLGLHLLACNRK
eukprot:432557-Amorphochlora_amoeboformis.AAC.1